MKLQRREVFGVLTAAAVAGRDFASQTRDEELLVRPGLRPGPFDESRRGVAQRRSLQRPSQECEFAAQVACRPPRRLGGLASP